MVGLGSARGNRLRRRLWALASLLALSADIFTLQGASLLRTVQASCNPGRTPQSGHWWDGWQRVPGGSVGGVYSTFQNYDSYVYGSSITSTWVLIFDNVNGRYAQVGWYEQPSLGYRDVFDEYVNTSGQQIRDVYDYPAGASDTYTVEYDPISKITTFKVQTVQLNQVVVSYLPNDGQVMGEVLNFANQMVGGRDDPVSLSGSRIYYSGGWKAFNGSVVNYDVNAYGNTVQNQGTDDIWDNACTY